MFVPLNIAVNALDKIAHRHLSFYHACVPSPRKVGHTIIVLYLYQHGHLG
jgi:hypothetical protein